MKLIFTLAIFLSSVSYADNIADHLCVNDARCTATQEQIAENFRSGTELPDKNAELLFQGGCYMISNVYSPTTKHHGYVYFRDQGFYGNFSFFYAQNPYANSTIADMRAKHSEASKFSIESISNAWKIEVNREQNWRYYVRQSLSGKTIVIGQWGINDAILCEMNQNF